MKLLAVFFICYSVIQNIVLTATPEEAHNELTILIQIAINQSTKATHALNSAGSIIEDLEREVLAVGNRNVLNEYAKITTEFNQILQSADKIGVNITKCTRSQWNVLEQVHQIAALEVVTCSNRFATGAQELLVKGLDNVAKIVSDVYDYESQLNKCQSNSACLDSAVAEIKYDKIDLPRRVTEELNYSLTKAEVSKLRLVQCEVDPAKSVINHGAAIIKEIQDCVDKIIGPSL